MGVPAGTYTVEVSSGDAADKDYTPWTTPPLLTTFHVGDIDYCTPAAAGADSGPTTAAGADSGPTTAAGSAAAGGKVCDFPKDVTGQLYTIPDIKTNEAGTLKFVFEKPKAGSISMKIMDQPTIIWSCSSSSSGSSSGSATEKHECVSLNSVPAGTYTVEVSSGDAADKDYTPWTTPPLLTTFYVGDIDYCTPAA